MPAADLTTTVPYRVVPFSSSIRVMVPVAGGTNCGIAVVAGRVEKGTVDGLDEGVGAGVEYAGA
jgi:hypothetical protein